MRVLVTGNAGFIGFHTAKRLLERGDSVVGIDVVNDYYDPALKQARLKALDEVAARSRGSYQFIRADLADRRTLDACFAEHTSSVYGANTKMPFSEHDGANHPVQFYAATKRANELMAHSYSHLFQLPTTGLRFFTVYGPWGRPDMAPYLFTQNIFAGRPIKLFNNGEHMRDFTYVDDIVDGILRASDDIARPNPDWDSANPDPATSSAPFRIFNIGNSKPVMLSDFIEAIEAALNKKAIRELLPMQPGDVPNTFADVSLIASSVGYRPQVTVREGVARFVQWYREYTG